MPSYTPLKKCPPFFLRLNSHFSMSFEKCLAYYRTLKLSSLMHLAPQFTHCLAISCPQTHSTLLFKKQANHGSDREPVGIKQKRHPTQLKSAGPQLLCIGLASKQTALSQQLAAESKPLYLMHLFKNTPDFIATRGM
jgi:hypothetical protein